MTNERGENEWQANVVRAAEILSNDYTLRDKPEAENEAEPEEPEAEETNVEEAPAEEPPNTEPPLTEPAAEQPEHQSEEVTEDQPKDEEPDTMIEIDEEAADALTRSLNPRP